MDTLDLLSLLAVAGFVVHWFNRQSQRARTALLASQLQPYRIERLMQQLTEGYMRALDENQPERQAQVLAQQQTAEAELAEQFKDFARTFAQLPPPQARTLRLALPGIERWLPQATFDTRRVMQVHAEGIARVVDSPNARAPRDRARTLMAEMFLMQHSCHWFCRSKTIASARMLAQHKTRYEEALDAVSPETRQAYLAVVNGPALG